VAELADVLEALNLGVNMIAALDVHYDETAPSALAAAVVFQDWDDEKPVRAYTVRCNDIASYIPGQFFQRELPCLLAVLREIQEPINVIVIDGYVSLGDKPGLGIHLWEALKRQTAVVGVAKTRFHSASAVEVYRGLSKTPLFVTAVGMEVAEAVAKIMRMAGSHRNPKLLKAVDKLARMISSGSGARPQKKTTPFSI
jgi:deoxyribonuclease V